MSFQVLCSFLSQVVFMLSSCLNFLYILDINCLSYIWLANTSSHSTGHLFTLLIVSLAVRSFLSDVTPFVHLCFCSLSFGVGSKLHCWEQHQNSFLCILFFMIIWFHILWFFIRKNFMILDLIFIFNPFSVNLHVRWGRNHISLK